MLRVWLYKVLLKLEKNQKIKVFGYTSYSFKRLRVYFTDLEAETGGHLRKLMGLTPQIS